MDADQLVSSWSRSTQRHAIPLTVRLSFYIGAARFSEPRPLDDLHDQGISAGRYGSIPAHEGGKRGLCRERCARFWIPSPRCRRRCGNWHAVQIRTWLGLFCMWLYFPVAVARNVFGAPDTTSPLYSAGCRVGEASASGCTRLVCFAFAFVLPAIARAIRAQAHAQPLPCVRRHRTALGRLSSTTNMCCCSRWSGVGIAWASTLSMPYSILAGSLPHEKDRRLHGDFQLLYCDARNHRLSLLRMGDESLAG